MARRQRSRRAATPFADKLALHQWLLSLFGAAKLEELATHLRDEALERLDENNTYGFHHALTAHFPALPELPPELLLQYDRNIVRHTAALNERRVMHGEKPVQWKYFQYLALLFTEIYLERYFADPESLRNEIGQRIAAINERLEEAEQIPGFDEDADAGAELNKLAFWMATGAGKTLIMHVNILQYRYYIEKYRKRRELNRVILLTPNEGLSQQHLREFQTSGIDAEIFDKEGGSLFSGYSVEIIEVTKLKDEMGEKTVAVEAFEGNNLVLVDEGHRGASSGDSGAWMRYRNALCEKGFSFEYSATFAQAVKGDTGLSGIYSRSTLFDYSYRYFYNDGFGKDYHILNLDSVTQEHQQKLYLTACLLAFFQQQKLYESKRDALTAFLIEKPLWVFVGSSVNAVRSSGGQSVSDVVSILLFLKSFIAERADSIDRIKQVLNQGLVSASGQNLFAGRFRFLNMLGAQPEKLFDEILAKLFNAGGGGTLYVENLKGAQGEIALRIGVDNKPFGVINVGDDSALVKLCEANGLETGEREFSGSLFHSINQESSSINLLIGSKKFTEGWNSWRVSTLGLMNIGTTEGAQIIQLFGRGVRLKGYNHTLKRSARTTLPAGLQRPKDIEFLETLTIFGVRANYMERFRDFLKEEGLPDDTQQLEFFLPVISDLGKVPLQTIRLKKEINGVSTRSGAAFRALAPIPTLDTPTDYLGRNKVVLNWYPRIQALKAKEIADGETVEVMNTAHLHERHTAFLDVEQLYFEAERFKSERGWHNLNITREVIEKLLADTSWYTLYIPSEELELRDFARVHQWREIAEALLKKYIERYYTFSKREWEAPHLEYAEISVNDPNLLVNETTGEAGYRIQLQASEEELLKKLEELKAMIESGAFKDWEFRGLKALCFDKHVYQPLLCQDQGVVQISPVSLNKGERRLLEDLKVFCDNNTEYLADKKIYLLRNLSRGKGIGFFEAGNFHPDFILWLVFGGKQYVTFLDPKGIRNIGRNDPKVEFCKTVKEIEQRLGKQDVVLNSFIVSNTPYHEVKGLWDGVTKDKLFESHIVFQEEDRSTYIKSIFERLAP